jgi:hypothetical protein
LEQKSLGQKSLGQKSPGQSLGQKSLGQSPWRSRGGAVARQGRRRCGCRCRWGAEQSRAEQRRSSRRRAA